MDEMTIDESIDGFFAAYNSGDADAAASQYMSDGMHVEVAQGNVNEGQGAIRDGLKRFLAAFPDAHWEEQNRIVARGAAAVVYRLTGSLTERLGPFEPRGQSLDLRGVHVLTFVDNGIAKSEDFWDAATFQRQMDRG